MFLRLTCLAMLLLPPMAAGEPKSVTVPVDFPTIKAAVDAAAPGDTVLIRPGQYQETLVLDKAVTIKGDAPEQVLIHNSVLAGVIIKVYSKDAVQLENLIVEHTDKEPDQNELKYPDLILVTGGKVELRQCVLRNGAGCGLAVAGDTFALAENCRMDNNAQAGVVVHGKSARARLVKNILSENAWGGISVFDEGTGEFVENTVTKNQRSGILIYGPGPEGVILQGNHAEGNAYPGIQIDQRKGVTLDTNKAVKNVQGGISIQTGSQVSARGNTCEENGGPGIQVAGVLTEAVLEANTSAKNKGPGILVNAGAKARVSGNTASENKASGIVARNWNTTAEIISNTCDKNAANGVLVALGATAPVDGNSCSENGSHGVAATDEGTTATIGTNTGEENADQTPLKNTPLARQGQVDKFHTGWALAAGQYDYLEQFVARLRDNKCRNAQGDWELDAFYDALSEGYWPQTWTKKAPFMERVKEWREQKPQSVAARILLAKTYVNYAWEARGGGYASEVTPEGLKGFKENLAEAEKVLKEAEALPEKDPELYEIWIYAGTGLNYKRGQQDALFERGVALAPDYFPMYNNMAFNLTRRWHGGEQDLEDFFKKAWDASKGACGDALYALLVAHYMGEFNCIYVGSGEMANWDGLDSGFQQLLKDFPDSNQYLNRYCAVACMFQKRELAAELFQKIGDRADANVWGGEKESQFRAYRRWATLDNQPFPCRDERPMPFDVSPGKLRSYLLMGSAALIGLSLIATLVIVAVFGGKAISAKR